MATAARQQPPWQAPQWPDCEPPLPPLKIWNSLTRSKTPFVPIDWKTKHVTWYTCGPTVYDDAHLGHARNYVTTDIIRRILRDFFNFNVKFVMNFTDVDDKIILRGRQQYLLARFVAENSNISENKEAVLQSGCAALNAYVSKYLPLVVPDIELADIGKSIDQHYGPVLRGEALDGGQPGDKEAKIKMHISNVRAASDAMLGLRNNNIHLEAFYASAQDVLLPYLDALHGSSINAEDHSIFTKLTRKYEKRFTDDMRALNCIDPDVITRVTEYIPQIVNFVTKIEENGFAYATSDGSVYFDIEAFEAAQNHYARLEPWNRNDTELQADGEGALSKKTHEKKSDADFALWKSSKPGEPSWPSPWGHGRPGWHIECSAMASDKLGSQMDIHSGGIDLAFPHHDNELAQSEAFWTGKNHKCEHQWVNYFMHMGHLHIQGSKMSKSLKNFTTIKSSLNAGQWTPRGLRIIFLLGGWREGIEITDDTIKAGSAWEDKVNVGFCIETLRVEAYKMKNFFVNVKDIIENKPQMHSSADSKHSGKESINGNTERDFSGTLVGVMNNQSELGGRNATTEEMCRALDLAINNTFAALCDSFNTPLAMSAVSELISVFNTLDRPQLSLEVVQKAGKWVTSIVNILGLNGPALPNEKDVGWSGISIPDAAKPYVYPLSKLRDELRRKARAPEGLTSQDLELAAKFESSSLAAAQEEGGPYSDIVDKFARNISGLKGSSNISKDVLQLCDRLRDIDLWDQGIYLEDRDGNRPALVRTVTKELLAARQEREERELQKQKAKEDLIKAAAGKAQKGSQSHLDMFRTSEYSLWNENGIPIKDKQGEELTKSKIKKLTKDWERQKKLHEAWLKSNA